jgi:hypothetical protein
VAILSASLIKAFAATLQLELETSFSIPATGEFEELPIMGNNTSTVHGGALCVGTSNPVGASSELLAIQGIDYVGPLPPQLQRSTVFSAGVTTGAKESDAARALTKVLASPAALSAVIPSGMEPVDLR